MGSNPYKVKVRQAKFCLRLSQVFFSRGSPVFTPLTYWEPTCFTFAEALWRYLNPMPLGRGPKVLSKVSANCYFRHDCNHQVHSRPRNCTPFTRITRVLREYYVRKANYAHLRVTCAYLRVTYLINIHKQR